MAKDDSIYKKKGLFEWGPDVYTDKEHYDSEKSKAGWKGFATGAGLGALGGALAGIITDQYKRRKKGE